MFYEVYIYIYISGLCIGDELILYVYLEKWDTAFWGLAAVLRIVYDTAKTIWKGYVRVMVMEFCFRMTDRPGVKLFEIRWKRRANRQTQRGTHTHTHTHARARARTHTHSTPHSLLTSINYFAYSLARSLWHTYFLTVIDVSVWMRLLDKYWVLSLVD